MAATLKQCSRVGLNVTKRCNWECQTCFYRWKEDFNTKWDLSYNDLRAEIRSAKMRGCDHTVAVGFGEVTFYPLIDEMVIYSKMLGMWSSIITNGSAGVPKYEHLFDIGLNHLHISAHGHDAQTLDAISGRDGAAKKQHELLDWLNINRLPFRTNATLQKMNYKQLPQIINHAIEHGAFHAVLLGFLPHYEWGSRMNEVAVPPAELQPFIEESLDLALQAGVLTTLRYHPLCCLRPDLWPYVTNARYVLYDPWEWDYGCRGIDEPQFRTAALNMGDSVAIQGEPCCNCAVRMQCGGWNRCYADGTGYAGLAPVTKEAVADAGYDPDCTENEFGYFFSLNPTNHRSGAYEQL